MTRIYDLAMTHQLDADDYFIHRIQGHCAELGLNFFLIEPLWAARFYECLAADQVWARVLLNMHCEHHLPGDIFHQLVSLAHSKRVQVIDPPDLAEAAFDKARMHQRLLAGGLNVPYTVLVPQNAADFRFTEEQRAELGRPFVIKPSHGYGRHGVILDAQDESDLARSAAAWPNPSYLAQRKIVPALIAGQPAYWRVFYVFGEVVICWWNCFTDSYREMTESEEIVFGLGETRSLVKRIAALSGMNFFSSEMARTESGEFVLIDYVNDQCHMLTQSSNPKMGVPDAVVARIARRLVQAAARLIAQRQRQPELAL